MPTNVTLRPLSVIGPWRVLAGAGFAYILLRPVSNAQILVPVLLLLGVLGAGTVVLAGRRLAWSLLPALLTTVVFGVGGLLIDPMNPGFTNAALVFLGAPLLFWVCCAAVDERTMRMVFAVAAWGTVAVGLFILGYVATSTGLLPAVIPQWLLDQTGAGFNLLDGVTQTRFYMISTLVAAGPMWAASLFVGQDSLLPPFWVRVLAAASALAGGLVAGRRALVVVLVLAPLLAWLVKVGLRLRRSARVDKRVLATAAGLGALALVAAPTLLTGAVVNTTLRGLTSFVSGDQSGVGEEFVRTFQSDQLLAQWSDALVFGHGLGYVIPGYARSATQPWQFELQYHAILMQTGLAGAVVILLGAAFVVRAALQAARARPDLAPSLVAACTAALAMVIANASNPYLQAPAHFWAVFLPIAVVNCILVGQQREAEEQDAAVLRARRWPVPATAPPPARRGSGHGRTMTLPVPARTAGPR